MPYPDFPQFSTPSSPAVPQLNVRRWVQHFDEPSSIFHAMGMGKPASLRLVVFTWLWFPTYMQGYELTSSINGIAQQPS